MIANKLIAVIIVLLIIFAGITLFLVNLDRRLNKMEKEWKNGRTEEADTKSK